MDEIVIYSLTDGVFFFFWKKKKIRFTQSENYIPLQGAIGAILAILPAKVLVLLQ